MAIRKTGLREVEDFIIKERKTFKGNNSQITRISKFKEVRKLVIQIMRRKLRGNNNDCIKLRRERMICEKKLVSKLGGKNREYLGIVRDTRKNCTALREEIMKKNKKKIEWLQKKYEVKYDK